MALPPACRPTPAQQTQIRQVVQALRAIAEPVGPLHAYWETIFDLEALLQGQPTTVPLTIDAQIGAAEALLGLRAQP